MDIFKLFFEHDLRLDELRGRQSDRSTPEVTSSLEDFLKPDPTYTKFYFTGTVLPDEKFGINTLENWVEIKKAIARVLSPFNCFVDGRITIFEDVIENCSVGEPILFSKEDSIAWSSDTLRINSNSNVGHKKSELAEVLQADDLVLYKELAHNGFDLHLFSKKNIYTLFFTEFQTLINDSFRFFSINGKKIRSEKHFYFETWTLHRPPHGAEEVFPETKI